MYTRILAALDGSRAARLALDEAVKLAKASGAQVVAVSVVEHPARLVDVGAVYMAEETPSPAATDAATAALSEADEVCKAAGVSASTRAVDAYGEDIATVIARTADECEADVIVMGTHGRRGVRRMLVGSVAESVLRAASVPVLMVRHDQTVQPDLGPSVAL
jgi:nucleotide-binding universal stress UspA family protein